jgi:hypothetical protein
MKDDIASLNLIEVLGGVTISGRLPDDPGPIAKLACQLIPFLRQTFIKFVLTGLNASHFPPALHSLVVPSGRFDSAPPRSQEQPASGLNRLQQQPFPIQCFWLLKSWE